MFSLKDQILNILGFAGLTASVATTQLCHRTVKAAIDNMSVN